MIRSVIARARTYKTQTHTFINQFTTTLHVDQIYNPYRYEDIYTIPIHKLATNDDIKFLRFVSRVDCEMWCVSLLLWHCMSECIISFVYIICVRSENSVKTIKYKIEFEGLWNGSETVE